MRIDRSFDVVVVGGGITGLATALHLQRRGVARIALASQANEPTASSLAAGLISGGQLDNFTRVTQAHTAERAVALWRFGDDAYDALVAYAEKAGVPHVSKKRLRLITSAAELQEAGQAVAGLTAAKFSADLSSPPKIPAQLGLLGRVLGVQDQGPRGGWIDPQALIAQLVADTRAVVRLPEAQSLTARDGRQRLRLDGGLEVDAEMVVLAAHAGVRALAPDLAPALVTYADQWSEWRLPVPVPEATGVAFTANNTYEWGVFTAPDSLRFGGGRYLRPMAGIEAKAASVEERITLHLRGKLAETFSWGHAVEVQASFGSLDISPCDELPLIGPLSSSGPVLFATGFMGAGLTLGFWAGHCLAELVATGSSPSLPRWLWPERLRTMSS